ncbi:pentapeptide repeat-containing protein, partial [Methylocystis sp. SB2]
LDSAQLQGASLDRAQMEATNLTGAFLWRAVGAPIVSASLTQHLHWGAETFDLIANEPWTAARYVALRSAVEKSIPEGERRNKVLEQIEMLDCARKDLAACDTSAKPQQPLAAELETANTHRAQYPKALAKIVRSLVCDGREDAIYILRGVMPVNLLAVGPEAPVLIGDIIEGKNCPVSAALIVNDRTSLLNIKREAEERVAKEEALQAPAPAPSPPRSQSKKKKPR